MKNIIKKITAVAMAFTLLGVGSVITNNDSTKSENAITAEAAGCQHHCYRYGVRSGNRMYVHCGNCGKVIYSYNV